MQSNDDIWGNCPKCSEPLDAMVCRVCNYCAMCDTHHNDYWDEQEDFPEEGNAEEDNGYGFPEDDYPPGYWRFFS